MKWPAVAAAGATFAFAQATQVRSLILPAPHSGSNPTQGTSYTDPQFSANWAGILAAGLIRGAYHFGNPCNSGVQEV